MIFFSKPSARKRYLPCSFVIIRLVDDRECHSIIKPNFNLYRRRQKSEVDPSKISLEDPDSHSHNARVAGDIMIVNRERDMTARSLPSCRPSVDATQAYVAYSLCLSNNGANPL